MQLEMEEVVLAETSALGARWCLRPADERMVMATMQRHGLPEPLARFLVARGVALDDVEEFLSPSLRTSLPDPSHLKDMDAAAERFAAAIMAGEKVAVFGDYDVDGATSSALLARVFRALGSDLRIYIPDRIKEGYGPNAPALLKLKEEGAAVVVTVDCGTLSFEPLAAAHEAGLDVIVIDHHAGEAELPKALAVVNPNRLDEDSPHGQMAAVGVVFLLAVAMVRTLRAAGWFVARPEPNLMNFLDIVALGTVCDVVPLVGVNRAFVSQGLKVMAQRRNPGIRALMDVARLDEKPDVYHAGFVMGPRVNAGGRVGKCEYGARLLATDDEAEAKKLAAALDRFNDERKTIESIVQEEAAQLAERDEDSAVLVLSGQGWHPGVIGIVAGRLKERYQKPVAVVAMDGAIGKASARSVPGFDFGAAVIAARQQGLLVAGGGHAMAAGFTAEEAQLEAVKSFFNQRLTEAGAAISKGRTTRVDASVSVPAMNVELAQLFAQAGPYGSGHSSPRFYVPEAKVVAADRVGQDHLKLVLTGPLGKGRAVAFAFRVAGTPLEETLLGAKGKAIRLVCELRLKEWMGSPQAGITVLDACGI